MDKRKDLIEYFEKVKNLEAAIYTHNTLQPVYLEKLKKQQPMTPGVPFIKSESSIEKPKIPEKPNLTGDIIMGLIFLVLGTVLSIMTLFLFKEIQEDPTLGFVAIMCLICICFSFYGVVNFFGRAMRLKSEYPKAVEAYREACRVYDTQIKSVKLGNEKRQKDYLLEKEVYAKKYEEFNSKKQLIVNEFNTISNELNTALSNLYDENIIFPKYRNLIAVSTIFEYLSSGRCSELEGPNGAYNLYEMELRQNIIISQLSSITRNLEQIKNNQYILYQEINNSNKIISDMLMNIGNELSISNYYAQMNTIALTSPRVSYGVII